MIDIVAAQTIRSSMKILVWMLFAAIFARSTVKSANVTYLKTTIEMHFSDSRHHVANNQYKMAAKTFIFDEFKRFGLETEYHSFTDVSAAKGTTFTNVVGVLKGDNFKTSNDKVVAIGAHYDTVSTTKGVDDNGSGVAAMLEVARQLTDMNYQRKNTVIFVSFDADEYEHAGSASFITKWVTPWLMKNYGTAALQIRPHGVIVLGSLMEFNTSANSQLLPGLNETEFKKYFTKVNTSMDSDGFQGDFLSVIYREPTNDIVLANAISSSAGSKVKLELFPLPVNKVNMPNTTLDMLEAFLAGEHRSFWEDNIPSVYLSDTGKYRGNMIQCYRNPCDDIETMLTNNNIDFLVRNADIITSAMHALSEPYKADSNATTESPITKPSNASTRTTVTTKSPTTKPSNASPREARALILIVASSLVYVIMAL